MDVVYRLGSSLLRISALLAGMRLLGLFIERILDFSFLTTFFSLMKAVVHLFDFTIDTQVLFLLVSYSLFVEVGILALKAMLVIGSYFKTR